MIRVENLHKYFGDLKVLKGINEHIQEGEVVAVIGPSGSGKSTFLRCLNLLETPTEGKIFVDDEQINAPKVDVNRIRQKMGCPCIDRTFRLWKIDISAILKPVGDPNERTCSV